MHSELQTRRRAVRVRPGQRRRGLARAVQWGAEPPARRAVRRPHAPPWRQLSTRLCCASLGSRRCCGSWSWRAQTRKRRCGPVLRFCTAAAGPEQRAARCRRLQICRPQRRSGRCRRRATLTRRVLATACLQPGRADCAASLVHLQVALAARTSCLTREAAYEALRSATSRPAAIVGASLSTPPLCCLRRFSRLARPMQPSMSIGLKNASAWASPRCVACSHPRP